MVKWTIVLAAAGFFGAAIFYSPYIGLNAQTPLTCPVCPNIDGAYVLPVTRFLRDTLIGGTLNAALFVSVGWVAWGIVRSAKWVKRTTTHSIS